MEVVVLLVYDLSRGLAKQMSLGLTGQQIDGIWHTAVLVYGREYCFGQGIETFTPGVANSLYGSPVESITMGMTSIPKPLFLEYITEMKKVWVKEKYHLLENNCNNFSDELCMFLLGKKIPAHITGLPTEFLKTPFGQMMKPMIEQMYGQGSSSLVPPPLSLPSKTLGASTTSELQSLIKKNKCVAVNFTSKTCGPCVQISPYFDELVADTDSKIVGVKVETSESQDICRLFQITATPTFIFFLDGKEFSKTLGANRLELKSAMDFLVYTGFPPHKHYNVDYRNIESLIKNAALGYKLSSNLDAIFKKLYQIIEISQPGFDVSSLETLHSWMKSTDYEKSAILPFDWEVIPMKLLTTLPPQSLFPLLDIMRLLLLNESIHKQIINTCSSLIPIYKRISIDSGTPTITMLLKFTCNLYSTREGSLDSIRDVTTSLVINNLTCSDQKLQQVAALTAYNMCWSTNQMVSSSFDSHWVSEILAALIEALKSDHETETGLEFLLI
jgi:desumoylating isopeptidase 1